MSEAIYEKLIDVLDGLPNGFPRTPSGVEMKLLKRIFTAEEAELFCHLRLHGESPAEISVRAGRPAEVLVPVLERMWEKGQILRDPRGSEQVYRLVPWIVGIYEFQLPFMDKELAEMCLEYIRTLGPPLFMQKPQISQVVPIETEIRAGQEALPYERVSAIIEKGKSFAMNECICKKQNDLTGRGCDKPREVCLAISEHENFFVDHPMKPRIITREETYDILRMAEDAGLVHTTSNVREGHVFICNCCGCCCGQLIGARKGAPNIINSHYFARIDPEKCTQCDTCIDTRCTIRAITKGEGRNVINEAKCIGCGLCVTKCPSKAITLIRKPDDQRMEPPADEMEWYRARARARGVDISRYE